MTLSNLNNYVGRGQNLSVLTDFAWKKKKSSLLSFDISWNIYPLQSYFEHGRIFLSKKKH
jgi:outer membrane protease